MSSNAISLSQQDGTMAFGQVGAQHSSSQYLLPETHKYRRFSSHFPADVGLTQPTSTYGGSSHLESDPYVSHTYSHHRNQRRSGSRNRIPQEPRQSNSPNHARGSTQNKTQKAGPSGQKVGGTSYSSTLPSRPRRYSSRSSMGSQEQLRFSEEGQASAYNSRDFEIISPAYHTMTQPVGIYPEEEEEEMGVSMGRSQGGLIRRPFRMSPPIVEAMEGGIGEGECGTGNFLRSASLSPHHNLGGHSTQFEHHHKPDVNSTDQQAGATTTIGSAHPDSSSPGNNSDQVAKAANDEEEAPTTWEVIIFNTAMMSL